MWNYKKDTLNVKYVVSSIFDPLGALVPFLVEPKLIIQQLWKENIEGDEKILEKLDK